MSGDNSWRVDLWSKLAPHSSSRVLHSAFARDLSVLCLVAVVRQLQLHLLLHGLVRLLVLAQPAGPWTYHPVVELYDQAADP